MARPPQHSYHQYAMRPALPGQGHPHGGGSYSAQGQAPQDPHNFYGPGPAAGEASSSTGHWCTSAP